MKCTWCFKPLSYRYYCSSYTCISYACPYGTLLVIKNDDMRDYYSYHYLNQLFQLHGSPSGQTVIFDENHKIVVKVSFIKLSLENYFDESNNLVEKLLKLKAFV